ncbi:hypothetical protein ACHAQH_009730 [Verticillium albo-atrum]
MAEGHQVDKSWMWVPSFSEDRSDTAGLFVRFRTTLHLDEQPPSSLRVHITADTRYKLYVNKSLVGFGPVKGDAALWFYDEVDVAPYLTRGTNSILVVVLRFFYSSQYATSFPRLPFGGFRIVPCAPEEPSSTLISDLGWEAAIDHNTLLRTNEPEDDFLHVYEESTNEQDLRPLSWVPVIQHEFQTSTGNAPPWRLSPRLIPPMKQRVVTFNALHNLKSPVPREMWESVLLHSSGRRQTLHLPPDTTHQLDLEVAHHITALVAFRFERPTMGGSSLIVQYSESYEDEPRLVPYLRTKAHRCDTTKSLYGPSDHYHFRGTTESNGDEQEGEEAFIPFHFRTFRFLRLTIHVGAVPLVIKGFDVDEVRYPLNVRAKLDAGETDNQLWHTSIRTLENCMHDCYEDCPFYEQLQYAMDTRSSCLFTYYTAGDDRLARQAIIQLHNSFQPVLGLTASRAPSHNTQVIPNFSLFWVCMVFDHLTFYGDTKFSSRFMPVVDAVLHYFHSRVGSHGLVVSDFTTGIWNFTDWTEEWRPFGIPPSVEKTGVSTFTNHLYAYTLRAAAPHLAGLRRPGLAEEYLGRADAIIQALRVECFDGEFFTDSLTAGADREKDYSQHNQAWAVLSGAVRGEEKAAIMRGALAERPARPFVPVSIAMAHYTLRALSEAGDSVYDEHFHRFWKPWRAQLALGVTTWEEDRVSQRSDCHAWGSAPIYEFMAEVAGLRPAAPGWATIHFQPRLSLYARFKASCPFGGKEGQPLGVAHVEWKTSTVGDVVVTLRFEIPAPSIIPVRVVLPGHGMSLMDTSKDILLVVKFNEGAET